MFEDYFHYVQSEPLQNEPHSVGVCGQVGSGRSEAVNGQAVNLQQRQTMLYGVPAPSIVHQRLQTDSRRRQQHCQEMFRLNLPDRKKKGGGGYF